MRELLAFPSVSKSRRRSMNGGGLAGEAKQVLLVRKALQECNWSLASSWLALVKALDAVPPVPAPTSSAITRRPAGERASQGGACVSCPANSDTDGADGKSSVADCICVAGYYRPHPLDACTHYYQ